MKFMMMIKSDQYAESGAMPSEKLLAAMGRYNEELVKAGVLLAGEGLHPSSRGAKIRYENGKRTVIDGPFAEAKELIAGFWIIQVKSREEAIEWARRVPFEAGDDMPHDGPGEIELRQVFEMADFSPELYQSDEARAALDSEREFRKRTGQE
jgi:hypothetical protein